MIIDLTVKPVLFRRLLVHCWLHNSVNGLDSALRTGRLEMADLYCNIAIGINYALYRAECYSSEVYNSIRRDLEHIQQTIYIVKREHQYDNYGG